MAGKYLQAPLVYVTFKIRTAPLPQLIGDQVAAMHQAMISVGLTERIASEVSQGELQLSPDGLRQTKVENFTRQGFFNTTRDISFLYTNEGLELRTTNYVSYDEVIQLIESILSALNKIDLLDFLRQVPVKELVFAYADAIFPHPNRQLSDYFSNQEKILPLAIFENSNDLYTAGNTQVTRIVNEKNKIFISIEQIQNLQPGAQRLIPQNMIEHDPSFGMPIKRQPHWDTQGAEKYYALLFTEASYLLSTALSEFQFETMAKSTHTLVSDTFRNIINPDICNVDWNYQD